MTKPKHRVLLMTGTLEAGGLERFVSRVVILGAEKGAFVPMVLCLSKRRGIFLDALKEKGIPVLEAPEGWARNFGALWRLRQMIITANVQVAHSQVNFSLLQQLVAVRLFTKTRFLVTERNCYPLAGWSRLRRVLQFYVLKLLGAEYTANSEATAKCLSALVRWPAEKIDVIPNGMSVPLLDNDLRLRIRARHGWKETEFVVGYVARFAMHKGQEYFLGVMDHVNKQLGVSLKVCFVGDGPNRTNVEATAAKMKGLSVTFLGIVDAAEMYQAFDCTALLSDYEGMPNVVIEAMANGLPVIANPVGNVEELFSGEAGLVNRSGDPLQTASLFVDLIQDYAKRTELGHKARQRIIGEYSIEKTFEILMKAYGI